LKKWANAIRTNGKDAFIPKPKGPKMKDENKKVSDMTTAEMRAKIAYLEVENEFLKKLKDPEPKN